MNIHKEHFAPQTHGLLELRNKAAFLCNAIVLGCASAILFYLVALPILELFGHLS